MFSCFFLKPTHFWPSGIFLDVQFQKIGNFGQEVRSADVPKLSDLKNHRDLKNIFLENLPFLYLPFTSMNTWEK